MVVDVALVETISKGVLGNDHEITTIEIGIPTVFGIDEALSQDHVGWDEASRIRSAEKNRPFRQFCQHVVTVGPAKPVIPLAAKRSVVPAGPKWEKKEEPGQGGQGWPG